MAIGDIDDEGSVRCGERAAEQREAGRLVFGDDRTDVFFPGVAEMIFECGPFQWSIPC